MGQKTELALSVLNGLVGDYLSRTNNGLATPMEIIERGRPVTLSRRSMVKAFPEATAKVAILIHGLMCNEDIWRFTISPGESGAPADDYGTSLKRDFGITPLYLRYNSGLPIAENGALFCRLMSDVVENYPVPIEEIILIGYSMGGLVARSGCHVASEGRSNWLPLVKRAFYVGTPHLGAPLERAGRLVTRVLSAIHDPYTQLIADIANLRSAGVKDLGDADLRHPDRSGTKSALRLRDWRHPVPLLPGIVHHLIAGTLVEPVWLRELFGDALVPVPSGTARGLQRETDDGIPPERVHVLPRTSHIALAHHPLVYQRIHNWMEGAR